MKTSDPMNLSIYLVFYLETITIVKYLFGIKQKKNSIEKQKKKTLILDKKKSTIQTNIQLLSCPVQSNWSMIVPWTFDNLKNKLWAILTKVNSINSTTKLNNRQKNWCRK